MLSSGTDSDVSHAAVFDRLGTYASRRLGLARVFDGLALADGSSLAYLIGSTMDMESDDMADYYGVRRPGDIEEGVFGDFVWPSSIARVQPCTDARHGASSRACPLYPFCNHNGRNHLCRHLPPRDILQLSMAMRSRNPRSIMAHFAQVVGYGMRSSSSTVNSPTSSSDLEDLSTEAGSSTSDISDSSDDVSSTVIFTGADVDDWTYSMDLSEVEDNESLADSDSGSYPSDIPVPDERWPDALFISRRCTLIGL